MLVQILPDTMTKFAQMGDATIYEPAGDQPQAERRRVPYQSRFKDYANNSLRAELSLLPLSGRAQQDEAHDIHT